MCYGGLATFGLPVVNFAQVTAERPLCLHPAARRVRRLGRTRAIRRPGVSRRSADRSPSTTPILSTLDDTFGLAPGLSPLRALWDANELAVVHAMAIPHRTRSHFDGQAILETGLDRPAGSADGWLNRLLQVMSGTRSGIAIAAGMPLSLPGPTRWNRGRPHSSARWTMRFSNGWRCCIAATRRCRTASKRRCSSRSSSAKNRWRGGNARRGGITPLMQAAAKILRQEHGPNIAAMEFSGWDTHANQGMAGGALDRLLGQLAEGLVAFRNDMGTAWQNTTLVIMTEFGRTARPNGTRGTDHGTAGAGFVLGPRLAKSAIVADWPGLSSNTLFEGRDLKPTLDTRAVLKAAIAGAFDLTPAQLDRVFPNSAGYGRLRG